YSTPVYKALKQVHSNIGISLNVMHSMNYFLNNITGSISDYASLLARSTKCSIITSREILISLCLLLPGNIGKHVVSEATKVVIRNTTRK
ncbi:hypothetical protein DBR06_SOUSAS47710009, partial [Sousa chinensis]